MMTDKEVLDRVHSINILLLKEFDRICTKHNIQYFLAYGSLLGAVRHQGMIPWDNDVDIWMTREEYERFITYRNEVGPDFEVVLPDYCGEKKYADTVTRIEYKKAHLSVDEDLMQFYGKHFGYRIALDIFLLDRTCAGVREKLQWAEMVVLYSMMNGYRHPKMLFHYSPVLDAIQSVLRGIGRLIPLPWLRARVIKVSSRYDQSENATFYIESTQTTALLAHKPLPRADFASAVRTKFEDLQALIPNGAEDLLRIKYGDYMKLPPEEERIPHMGKELVKPERFQFDDIEIDEKS